MKDRVDDQGPVMTVLPATIVRTRQWYVSHARTGGPQLVSAVMAEATVSKKAGLVDTCTS